MSLSIKEYKKIINNSKKDYEKICNIHKEYGTNLKKCSNDELLSINVKSNTTVKDLKMNFEDFERWYSKFFNQLNYRLNKYYDILSERDNISNTYYKDAITDCAYVLLNLINDQQMIINAISIDSELLNTKNYTNCLEDLSKTILGLVE